MRDRRTEQALYIDRLWQEVVDTEAHRVQMAHELSLILSEDEEFEDDEHESEYTLQEEVLEAAVQAVAVAQNLHDAEKKKLKKITAEVNKMERKKEHGKTSQDLWLQTQRLLRKEFNIYASSYHGGDMEGNECRRLLREADPVMDALESLFLEYVQDLSPDERKGRANVDEIKLFMTAFKRLFQYMDLLSHFCYQSMNSMSDEDLIAAENVWVLATDLWVNLMPTVPMKVHCWVHLIEDLRRLRGMKQHNEHGIERSHQDNVRHARRVGCLRDFKTKTDNILRHTATAAAPEVLAMHKDTELKKRKRTKQDTKTSPPERILYLQSIPLLPPVTVNIPTLLELSKAAKQSSSSSNGIHC